MKVIALVFLVAVSSAFAERAWERIHGKRGNSPRIVGGEEVVPHSVPYQIALDIVADDGNYFCGGSLLTESIGLTAAHCCELTNNITITAGAHNITTASDEATQQKVKVANITIHPNWDSAQLVNDICLLKLEKPVQLNEAVGTVNLPTRSQAGDNFADRLGTATGWGLDSDLSSTISAILRTVTAVIPNNAKCRQLFGILGLLIPLHETNICLDGTGGKSTCSGDSGGPLTVVDNLGNRTIVGLTSFGVSTGCEGGYPGVFTRITSYLDWIALETGIAIKP